MLSTYPVADRRRVFLACRSTFSGQNAHIRQSKAVRKVLLQHNNALAALLKDFGFDKTAEIIKTLLEHQIFESELKAKIEFPELFQTSPARNVQHTESENDAARSEAEALEVFVAVNVPDTGKSHDGLNHPAKDPAPNTVGIKAPSLYPLSIPYSAQHIILVTTQHQLEDCCFGFTSKWLPKVLEDNGWDCAEAVELTKWAEILPKLCEKLPTEAVQYLTETSLEETLHSTRTLRNSAVHRLPTSCKSILGMLSSAIRLAMALGDVARAVRIEVLQADLESRVLDMQLHKNFLENRLDEELQAIGKQREELRRREEEAISTMLREDKENKLVVGSLLESSVKKAFRTENEDKVNSSFEENGWSAGSDAASGQNEGAELDDTEYDVCDHAE